MDPPNINPFPSARRHWMYREAIQRRIPHDVFMQVYQEQLQDAMAFQFGDTPPALRQYLAERGTWRVLFGMEPYPFDRSEYNKVEIPVVQGFHDAETARVEREATIDRGIARILAGHNASASQPLSNSPNSSGIAAPVVGPAHLESAGESSSASGSSSTSGSARGRVTPQPLRPAQMPTTQPATTAATTSFTTVRPTPSRSQADPRMQRWIDEVGYIPSAEDIIFARDTIPPAAIIASHSQYEPEDDYQSLIYTETDGGSAILTPEEDDRLWMD